MTLSRFCSLALLGLLVSASPLLAHCQVPCGIYDDAARIAQIREDIKTIEKATHMISSLTGQMDAESQNQLVRWVNTKEEHASHIIEIVSEYFLTQKIKPGKGPGRDRWLEQLADHHLVLRAAMKTKQTVSLDNVAALKSAVDKIALYWDPEFKEAAAAKAQTRPSK